ncbi:uncharacterized protein LOC119989749 [Tripterygium wilfordii]|uniref:uncharacterized protein LOC119989749 n=1 Tax=Tripterygium wilfordii TaxID=458696 RepID=UPI0018F84A0D|nr:uncharacterized protein LOC119989749 [Tripterygium wilfordii]
MASASSASALSLKLFIDTKKDKVLFAEAGKDVVDFLFNILSMPVATVFRLLKTQCLIGSLGNLHQSVDELNDTYFVTDKSKGILLKPKLAISTANIAPLLFPNSSAALKTCYRCPLHVSDDESVRCPQCNDTMYTEATSLPLQSRYGEGGYVKGIVTYMIMDDLVVKPTSSLSIITDLLDKFNVKDVGALEQKKLEISANEAMKMLKASFMSKTVLTDVFLREN